MLHLEQRRGQKHQVSWIDSRNDSFLSLYVCGLQVDLGLGSLAEGLQLPSNFSAADPAMLSTLDMHELNAATRQAVILISMGTRLVLIAAVLVVVIVVQFAVLGAWAMLRKTQRWQKLQLPPFLVPPRMLLMVLGLTITPAAEAAGNDLG